MKQLILLFIFNLSLFASHSFLMPDEAFQPNATLNSSMQIEADIKLAKKMYLYEDKVHFSIKNNKNISITKIVKPNAIPYHEDMVYLQSPHFIISIQSNDTQTKLQQFSIEIAYQGCSQAGLCYEPLTKEFKLSLNPTQISHNLKPQIPLKKQLSQTDDIANSFSSQSIFLTLLSFFGFGLLLSLTPCVFPMVPIISGLIISQGKGLSTSKAFSLSLVYVLAMAVAYTIAGILAGLFGANLQAALQTPWVIYSFSAIFVALSLSMFGFYELKLPDKLVNKVSSKGKHSGYIGVAIMGFLSALIVGPCVAAPLAGALVYIGQTGDALLGGSALFSMSIGMGIPLIVVGVSAGKFMPKPGAWMNLVSVIFGVMMLGVAIWMLQRVIDNYLFMLLFSLLGIGFSFYLYHLKLRHFIKSTLTFVLTLYSIALFIGALGGSKSMTQPLDFLSQKNSNTLHKELKFQTIHSINELDKLLTQHKGKKILLDFSASWCTSCKELDEITFSDLNVQNALKEYALIRADLSKNTLNEKILSKKYGVFGPPVIIFFDKNTNLLNDKTIVGFKNPQEFLSILQSIR